MTRMVTISVVIRMVVWVFLAFWLWLGLAVPLRRLPFVAIVAAVLGWVAAGLALPWIVPPLTHWVRSWVSVARHFLSTV